MPDNWRFTVRLLMMRAVEEASALGATTVEGEHLLLAVTAHPDLPAARVLAEVGWDHVGVLAALEAERAAALSAAGMAPVAPELLAATPRRVRPRIGASGRAALERGWLGAARASARRTHTSDAAAVVGAIEAETGTVPRMLAYGRIDREALVTRLLRKAAA